MRNHPTTRVLTVLELLQTHGRLSGTDLAARLEVDRRTVRRYIALLEEIGVPILAERGPLGGYELVSGYKLPPMMFTHDEALALSLGLVAAGGLGLANAAQAIASAQAKLERVMPASIKGRLRSVGDSVTIAGSRLPVTADGSALAMLSASAHGRQGVRLEYCAPSGARSERDFDPYGLAFRGGRWYTVGFCHLRRGLRSFRLDRVTRVAPQTRPFERPAGFDIADHLARSIATLPRRFAIEVVLHTDLESAKRELFETIGILEPAGDGVVALYGQTDDLHWFARELARLPCAFEIRKPSELADAVVSHAQALLAEHRRSAARIG